MASEHRGRWKAAEQSPARIHVVGNAALDVFVRTRAELPGDAADGWGANTLLLPDPIDMTLGGCGAAPAYVLGALFRSDGSSHSCSLTANIGSDHIGNVIRSWLAETGVEIVTSQTAPSATSVHVVQVDDQGRRRSFYYAGDKVEWSYPDGPSPVWLLASGYGRVDDEDIDRIAALFKQARENGSLIAFDPSPWFGGRVDSARMLGLWKLIDGLVATQEEMCQWLSAESAEALAQLALELGPQWVVVKRGGQGAVFASRDGNCGTVTTDVVSGANTVGAGDTLNGRLLYGLIMGEDLSAAVGAGVELATKVVRNGCGVLAAFER